MARKGSNNEGVIAPDSSTSMGMNHRVLSKTIVRELLECPICMNIMYPPIHQLFNCFGSHFCLHFEAFDLQRAPVYMAFVHFMGEEHDATKFNYSLEVGGNDRKLTWQGVPRSIRDSRDTVRESLDGLIIHRNMTLFFSGGNSQELKLNVTGRIWEIQS
ncbi:E3 ubiquitin- ligase SINAT2-like [Olea europaea subsp. europaea]|uniref:E3 ubiquitin- ligase SINAT2-like n=1 Tax=Olea europaea subsp. europaea TaxID=158383 RepID=A0A8S0S740_OLEEU|nr:E3 ubiquitin- ligase SINAT2-like [Olea europaea subsp. europaea]